MGRAEEELVSWRGGWRGRRRHGCLRWRMHCRQRDFSRHKICREAKIGGRSNFRMKQPLVRDLFLLVESRWGLFPN